MSKARSDDELTGQANELIRKLELVGVTFDRVLGEVRDRSALDFPAGQDVPARITVMVAHLFDEGGLAFKHDAKVSIGGSGDGPEGAAAIVETSIIVQFRSESPLEPDHEKAMALGQTYSHKVMYPYLRELVQTTLARLGVAGATLAMSEAAG